MCTVAEGERATSVSAHAWSALSVCAVVHVVTHFLSRAWGDCASESLGGAQQLLHPAAMYTACT